MMCFYEIVINYDIYLYLYEIKYRNNFYLSVRERYISMKNLSSISDIIELSSFNKSIKNDDTITPESISDRDILNVIYEKYFKGLVLYSLLYTHRSDIAEDIVQEVIINFFEKKRYLQLNGSILNYLRGAVIKASIKYNRDNCKLVFENIESKTTEDIILIMGDDSDDVIIKKMLSSIEELPNRSKEIVKLIVFENKKQSQVAEELSISINSVKSQYYKSLMKIKDILKKSYSIFF